MYTWTRRGDGPEFCGDADDEGVEEVNYRELHTVLMDLCFEMSDVGLPRAVYRLDAVP